MKNRKQIFGKQKLMLCLIAFVAIIGLMTACDIPGGKGQGNSNDNSNEMSSWFAITSPFEGVVASIAYGNNTFVAGSWDGEMARSTNNGVNWTLVSYPHDDISGIAFGNNTFIAAGDRGKMARSTNNGAAWTSVTSPFNSYSFNISIAYGNNIFVAGDYGGKMIRSTDYGLTCTLVT
jgi:photosystem II stability/assembly factor-like uncharacterized protein